MVTSVEEWKQGTELDLPSGNTCLVRNPGMQAFLRAGIIPDSLTGLVREALTEGAEQLDISKFMEADEDLETYFQLFDDVLLEVVVKPDVHPVPMDDETGKPVPLGNRPTDQLYVDEVDFDDKVFIFQFAVGGTRDLETFRQEQAAQLASVSAGKNVEGSTE